MNIDDIPLPPIRKADLSYEQDSLVKANPSTDYSGARAIPAKRVFSNKLPIGMLRKEEHISLQKNSSQHKKELFLPTFRDRLQLAMTDDMHYTNGCSPNFKEKRPDRNRSNHKRMHRSKSVHSRERSCYRNRRRSSREPRRMLRAFRERSITTHRDRGRYSRREPNNFIVKSQVVVKRRAAEPKRLTEHQRKRRDLLYQLEDERQFAQRTRRTHSRSNDARRRYSGQTMNQYRNGTKINNTSHRLSRSRSASWKYVHRELYVVPKSPVISLSSDSSSDSDSSSTSSSSRKNSVSSASSASSSTSSKHSAVSDISSSAAEELPAVSPKSPESMVNKVERSQPVSSAAVDYLRQLSDTLQKMNNNYRSLLPDHSHIDVSSIPLPESCSALVSQQPPAAINASQLYGGIVKISELSCPKKPDINLDDISVASSNRSVASKDKSPPFGSLGVSAVSKYSDGSAGKCKPTAPKITKFSIDFADLPSDLYQSSFACSRLYQEEFKCCCSIPNPDQWVNGARACGPNSQCVMINLQVQCFRNRCLTETLCCNDQFSTESDYWSKNVEFFFDSRNSSSWKLRSKRALTKNSLLFQIGGKTQKVRHGEQRKGAAILINDHIRLRALQDRAGLIYYVIRGSQQEANVHMKKWLVGDKICVGMFAARDLLIGELLIMHFPNDLIVLSSVIPDNFSDNASVTPLLCHLCHEPSSADSLLRIVDCLLSSPITTLQRFVLECGPAVLCACCDGVNATVASQRRLLSRLIDFLSVVPFSHRPTDGNDLIAWIARALPRLAAGEGPLLRRLDVLATKLQSLFDVKPILLLADDADEFQCRLPPFWAATQCIVGDQARVFYFHRRTRAVQWDMPVYPWETNDDDDIDIYDYNGASAYGVSHEEISLMYVSLNEMYEMKQRRLENKERDRKTNRHAAEDHKRHQFRNKIISIVTKMLRPYRDASCRQGRIINDDDLNYLVNKLAMTILKKELKILKGRITLLDVTPQVENKTKCYVRMYMESRGPVYKRPTQQHQSPTAANDYCDHESDANR